jgi:hypothetical protein
MKIKISVSTRYIGSKDTEEIEIDDEELEGMTEEEQEKYIEEIAKEQMFEMIDWTWWKEH